MDSFLSILPNLSIGVVAVIGMIYLSIRHGNSLERQQENFLAALDKQQQSFRDLEADVRRNLTDQLTKNTVALTDVAKLLAHVSRKIDDV
jgi:hypothetical protein